MRQASLYTSYKKANLKNWINKHKKQKDALRASQTKKSHKSMENLKSKDFNLCKMKNWIQTYRVYVYYW